MPRPHLGFSLVIALLISEAPLTAADAPSGLGQLETPPALIPGGTDEAGREFSYLGQLAAQGKIVLTASNGFFTKGTCKAEGTSDLPKVGDDELIAPNFEFLNWQATEGSLRWHLLIKTPGTVHFHLHLKASASSEIDVSFAGETKRVRISPSRSGESPPLEISFDVRAPGEHLLSLTAASTSKGEAIGQLSRIDVFGPAIDEAHLLRVRWRPAAAHGGYDTSKVTDVKLLVFTTRNSTEASSYSPITTPFGYFGTSFDEDQRSNGSFNFSMWGKKGAESDLKMMPHLLGIGSPDGEFSGFGHEGSGVKPRGWLPMPDRPELVVQALRLVPGDEYDSYFGYYFNHPTSSWKFYGGGKKWHDGKSVSHLKLGSFCEVPGPPQVERTGDIYREVRRRAWALDGRKWVPLDDYHPGGNGSSGNEPVNKRWYTTEESEYAMGCGGIRLYHHTDSAIKSPSSNELPSFLSNPSVRNLLRLPIEFSNIETTRVSRDRALIEVNAQSDETIQSGTIFYGKKDALTFAPRELHSTEQNSRLSQSINHNAWTESKTIQSASTGVNQIELTDLDPDTTYFYRILLTNSISQIWSDQTYSFKTSAR